MMDVTLVFEKAGTVLVNAAVEAPAATHAHDFDTMDAFEKEQKKAGAKSPAQ
jgi:periplasmic copper chaperone A